jgi:hypothetical protein
MRAGLSHDDRPRRRRAWKVNESRNKNAGQYQRAFLFLDPFTFYEPGFAGLPVGSIRVDPR